LSKKLKIKRTTVKRKTLKRRMTSKKMIIKRRKISRKKKKKTKRKQKPQTKIKMIKISLRTIKMVRMIQSTFHVSLNNGKTILFSLATSQSLKCQEFSKVFSTCSVIKEKTSAKETLTNYAGNSQRNS